ncbi:MAG: hypothetical protein ACR2RE_00845 [Geminicoccaceae bacterium]
MVLFFKLVFSAFSGVCLAMAIFSVTGMAAEIELAERARITGLFVLGTVMFSLSLEL